MAENITDGVSTEVYRLILWEAELSQVSILNTKGVDVAYLQSRYEKPRCREG